MTNNYADYQNSYSNQKKLFKINLNSITNVMPQNKNLRQRSYNNNDLQPVIYNDYYNYNNQ